MFSSEVVKMLYTGFWETIYMTLVSTCLLYTSKRCRCHHSEQGAGQRRDDRRGRAFEVSLRHCNRNR